MHYFDATGARTKPCGDVPTGSPFCGDIAWPSCQNITGGDGDRGFHPAARVTRQAMAAFLHRPGEPGAG
jgi:hypothetical protein